MYALIFADVRKRHKMLQNGALDEFSNRNRRNEEGYPNNVAYCLRFYPLLGPGLTARNI